MVLGWSTTSSTRPCLESLPSIVRMAFSSCFNGLSYRVFPSWSRACAWCALLPTSRPTHTSMSSGVIIVPPVMKVFRSPRARRSPDARAAPTLRRDLRHAPLKRPCSRPGSYQRSSGVPVPGDNTPRIIDDRAGKSYRNRRPGPDHRGLPNMVMGSQKFGPAENNVRLTRRQTHMVISKMANCCHSCTCAFDGKCAYASHFLHKA